jgi:hypothetical protein
MAQPELLYSVISGISKPYLASCWMELNASSFMGQNGLEAILWHGFTRQPMQKSIELETRSSSLQTNATSINKSFEG